MEPWFGPHWAWLPGTLLGVLTGVWGSLLGVLASRGRGRRVLTALYLLLLVTGCTLLVAGVTGLALGQPYGVWYALLLPGILTLAVVGPLGWMAQKAFRLHEERQMQAQDF